MSIHQRPYIKIIEQPSKSLRYRYSCEGRPGRIPGASSTPDNKIPASIQIVGYEGRVVILVSCVSKETPYRPHPHKLVGQNCRKGVCSFETEINTNNNLVSFPKLAIQCVKKKDVVEALKIREEKKVDPFLTGFDHKDEIKSIDLHVVRLCFQVFLVGGNRTKNALTPVVSDPIYNKKFLPDPLIYRLSHCNGLVTGRNEDIILLCTKVIKDDIKIRFFQTENDEIIWEDFGVLNQIYNHTAICFRPPKYYNLNISEPTKVSLQLVRPSDGVVSPVVPFEYLPVSSDPNYRKQIRNRDPNYVFAQLIQESNDLPQSSKIAKLDENPLLVDVTSWYLPETLPNDSINDINGEASSSRRSTLEDISTFNIITDDLNVASDVNLDSASGVCQVLNMDCNQIVLEPLNISSGDLEMTDVERLSGSIQEHLYI